MIQELIDFCNRQITECKKAINLYDDKGDDREVRKIRDELEIHYDYLKELKKYNTKPYLRDEKIDNLIN